MEHQQNQQDLVATGGSPAEVPNDPGYVNNYFTFNLF